MSTSASLFLVATPIGNLGDLSARAIEVLRTVALIAAEDTRVTAGLLAHCGIGTPLLSLHEHNEHARIERVLSHLAAGESVAIVSDAGTPLVSDPGYPLARAVIAAGFTVVPVPGACAAIVALVGSGLPPDRFVFEGFPPQPSGKRRTYFASLRNEPRTLIFYESPHRVVESLSDMALEFGAARSAVVARELTKKFETFLRGTLEELVQRCAEDANQRRGEIVILVQGAELQEPGDAELDRVLTELLSELPAARAAGVAARLTGAERRRAYERALAIKG